MGRYWKKISFHIIKNTVLAISHIKITESEQEVNVLVFVVNS